MQSPRALGRLPGDVARNLCLIDIGMSFDQIVDGAHYIGRFDDEQRLAHAHGVACACAYLQHSARVRRKDRGQTILVEGDFSARFKIEIDSLLPDGFDTNLFQLFRRGRNHTRREYAVRLCRSWFLTGRLAQKQKDCAHYGNDPGSKPESSSPFRGWLDIFSIARCQVIHTQLRSPSFTLHLHYTCRPHAQASYSTAQPCAQPTSELLLAPLENGIERIPLLAEEGNVSRFRHCRRSIERHRPPLQTTSRAEPRAGIGPSQCLQWDISVFLGGIG